MAILTIPKVLREKLGDEGVEALIALLNEAAHHERNNLLGILEERFGRRVVEEGKRLEHCITEASARLDNRITEEVAKLQQQIAAVDNRITAEMAKMDKRIAEVRADLIRWMFLFWVGQLGTLVAILFAFFK
ncbi:MAG: hypothetical protein Q9M35_00210 [Rhodothermus sp.]|nr:hypothetical protein [Rhodothermus sp.]